MHDATVTFFSKNKGQKRASHKGPLLILAESFFGAPRNHFCLVRRPQTGRPLALKVGLSRRLSLGLRVTRRMQVHAHATCHLKLQQEHMGPMGWHGNTIHPFWCERCYWRAIIWTCYAWTCNSCFFSKNKGPKPGLSRGPTFDSSGLHFWSPSKSFFCLARRPQTGLPFGIKSGPF